MCIDYRQFSPHSLYLWYLSRHATGSFYMKHSVYTAYASSWLHRHRLIHMYTRARLIIRTQTHHTYTGWPESGVGLDARATRSIRHVASCASTPRNAGTPLPHRPCLFSFSLSRSLFYPPPIPLYAVADVFAHPREKGRYDGNGLSAGRRLGEEILRSAEFFDAHSPMT